MADTPPNAGKPAGWLSERVGTFLRGSNNYATPDITKIQALAIAQAFIAVLIVLGVKPDEDVQQTIIGLAVVLGAVLPISDVAVRRSRATHSEAIVRARLLLESRHAASPTAASAADRRMLDEAETALAEARLAAARVRPGARTPS